MAYLLRDVTLELRFQISALVSDLLRLKSLVPVCYKSKDSEGFRRNGYEKKLY